MNSVFVKCIEAIAQLERKGRIEEAKIAIESCYENFGEFTDEEQNILQIRKGAVCYYSGDIEEARDLFSEIKDYFLDRGDLERLAECNNYLALCYLKAGEISEAQTYLKESSSLEIGNSYQRLYSYIIRQMIFLDEARLHDVINMSATCYRYFETGDESLRGIFINNAAIAFKDIGQIKTAITSFLESKTYFEKIENLPCLGMVCNNLALCYLNLRDYESAKKYALESVNIFAEAKNATRQASALDTFANIYLAECEYENALTLIDDSIGILKKNPNTLYLLESYKSKVAILHAMGKTPEAMPIYNEARNIALTYCGEEWTRKYDHSIGEILKSAPPLEKESDEFPFKMKGGSDGKHALDGAKLEIEGIEAAAFYGVMASPDYCDWFGIPENSLLIVADMRFEEGEIAAVLDEGSGKVCIGIYSIFYDEISLETPDGETRIFLAAQCDVLGKVIGVGERTEKGTIKVHPF